MRIKRNGYVGIGTSSPSSILHISTGTSGDAILLLEADTDNNNEADNPRLVFKQDGGNEFSSIGHGAGVAPNQNALEILNSVSSSGGILFGTSTTSGYTNAIAKMFISGSGNVGIGTTSPDEKLTVKGTIHTEEVRVDLNVPGPDYVFEADYNLSTLEETASFVQKNKHLPEIPSALEMEANGINLGEMNMLLLKKIEELTLHLISQEQRIKALEGKR